MLAHGLEVPAGALGAGAGRKVCAIRAHGRFGGAEFEVLLYEFKADIAASNGVIHVIDSVIMPK